MNSPHGYGLLQPGDRQRALTDSEIKNKNTSFVVLRERWSYLEPTQGKYDFSRLLQQMNRCKKLGKPYTISVMTGDDCNPDWLVKRQPWSLSNLKSYASLQSNLSNTLKKGDYFSHVVGVWITGPTVPSQEMHLNGADKYTGYSVSKMESAWKEAIKVVNACYPDQTLILSISGQSSVKPYLDKVIAQAKLLGKDRVVFQHNSLGTQTSTSASHHKTLLNLYREGFSVGAEMVQPGHVAGIKKFPQAQYIVLYPGDQNKVLPVRPQVAKVSEIVGESAVGN